MANLRENQLFKKLPENVSDQENSYFSKNSRIRFINERCPATDRGYPRGSGYVKAPDHLDVRHYKGGRLSALPTGHLYPRRNPWYSFSEAESTSGYMILSEGTTEKIPSDTTGYRFRDRPTSSAAP
jgi:hypothetical protein